MTRRTDPQVVVITGASSGIGKATALAFARDGTFSMQFTSGRGARLREDKDREPEG